MNQTILNRARNDKFLLVMDLPPLLKKEYDSILNKSYNPDSVQFTVFGSPVPTVNVPNVPIIFDGQVHQTSSTSRPAYPPLVLSFLIDNGFQNYWILWKWLSLFNDPINSGSQFTVTPIKPAPQDVKLKYPLTDLVTSFKVFGLDEYNNPIIQFNYTNIFPTTLSEIRFNHQEPNEMSCQASFVFNQLHVDLVKDVSSETCG
jgi:hypothetical protein